MLHEIWLFCMSIVAGVTTMATFLVFGPTEEAP